jgi:hypothetical protein
MASNDTTVNYFCPSLAFGERQDDQAGQTTADAGCNRVEGRRHARIARQEIEVIDPHDPFRSGNDALAPLDAFATGLARFDDLLFAMSKRSFAENKCRVRALRC